MQIYRFVNLTDSPCGATSQGQLGSDAEYVGKRKQTRKELFLLEMDQVGRGRGCLPGLSLTTRKVKAVVLHTR